MPPVTMKNAVNRLDWNVPIANKDGTPTYEFQVKWAQQAKANAAVPDLTTGAGVSAVLDLIGATKGMTLYRSITAWTTLAGATGHDGWLYTWNDATGLPEWRTPPGVSGIPAAIFIDGSGVGQMALVDVDGLEVLDGSGKGIYIANPTLPDAMIPIAGTPTTQRFTATGAGTWNRPSAAVKWIRVRFKAGGGGGSGSGGTGTVTGTDGTVTTFNGINANPGKGAAANIGGAGGDVGTGTANDRKSGAAGGNALQLMVDPANFVAVGGQGAGNGGGLGGGGGAVGSAGKSNQGGGGGGGGLGSVAIGSSQLGAGGGEAEEVILIIVNPASSYAFNIGDGGAGGAAASTPSGFAGGKGGSGVVYVEEFYA